MFRKAVIRTSSLLTTCLVVLGLWASPVLAVSPPEADSSFRVWDGYDGDFQALLSGSTDVLPSEGSSDLGDGGPGWDQSLTISGVFAPTNVAVRAETISAGAYHTCGLRTDGTVACWGYDSLGQSSPPGGTFTQVSAGERHTCGLQTDGTMACWGDNILGQSSPPSGTFTQVSAGYNHTCGLKTDGTVACWGLNNNGEASPPGGTFSQVSAG